MQQHSVTAYYLRGFLAPDEGRLWVYPRDGSEPRPKPVSKCTVEENFYSPVNGDGVADHSVELTIGDIETTAAPGFKRLIAGHQLTQSERRLVSRFLAVLMLRVVRIRDFAEEEQDRFESPDGTRKLIDENRAELSRIGQLGDAEKRVASGQGSDMGDKFYFPEILKVSEKVAPRINAFDWTIEVAIPGEFFVTSDNPAFPRQPRNIRELRTVGIDELGMELGVPLSRERFLTIRRGASGLIQRETKATRQRVEQLNFRTVISATHEVFAPIKSEGIASLISQASGISIPFQPTAEEAEPDR